LIRLKGRRAHRGTDIREVSTLDLRGQIGVVNAGDGCCSTKPSAATSNWAVREPTEAEIIARETPRNAHEFIMEKEGGYDGVIVKKA